MVLPMSRPWKHPKTGVYWLRKRVPDHLQAFVGKREELKSLATKDVEIARVRFAQALVEVQRRWENLRAGTRDLSEQEAHRLAMCIHDNWIARHAKNPSEQFFWKAEWYDRLWTEPDPRSDERGLPAEVRIDQMIIPAMRRFCLRHADLMIADEGLIIDDWSRFRLAKAIGSAFQRASLTLRDVVQGRTDPSEFAQRHRSAQVHASLQHSAPKASSSADGPVTLTWILESWWREAKAAGRKPSTYESYRNTFTMLGTFLGHEDAGTVTASEVVSFKDHRLTTPSPKTGRVASAKTVKDSDLSALKTVFGWALSNHILPTNPAAGITIKVAKAAKLRSKGFTDDEAKAILHAALRHSRRGETLQMAAAKRWVPWLCAFTGARVGEIAQLRKQDLRRHGELFIVRITPEAGTVKTNEAREIVLHRQVVELGFPEFVAASSEGPLFLRAGKDGNVLGPLQGTKNRLAEFARGIVSDSNVAPNHGWRHRFKTIGMEAGVAPRILDAIQGQAARTVADTYGDVSLKTIGDAIMKFPAIDLSLEEDTHSAKEAEVSRIG